MMPRQDVPPRQAWTITGLIAVLMIINFLDKVVLGLVAVPMMAELRLTPVQFGLIGGSLHWLYAVAAVGGGLLANRLPARWLLLGMALLWSVVQLPLIFTQVMWLMIVCRVLLGVGEGPATPIATHAIYKWFPDHQRSLPVALIHQGSALGLLTGGLLIPHISHHWGWRTNFALLALVGFVWAGVWLLMGAEGRGGDKPAVGLPAPTAVRSIPYARLLTDPTILGNYISHFGANWVLGVVLVWLPSYLQKGLGYDGVAAGKLFALFVLLTLPVSLGLAWLSQHLLRRGWTSRRARGMLSASALVLAGMALLAATLLDLPGLARFALLACGTGLTSVVFSIGPAMLGEIVPTNQRAAVLSMSVVFTSLAGFLSPLVSGVLLQATGTAGVTGYDRVFMVAGGVILACGVLLWRTAHPQQASRRLADGGSYTASLSIQAPHERRHPPPLDIA